MSTQYLHRQRGFTIVELLIVIVVIAILATIAIVTYSGIQKQAASSAVQSALSNAATAMKVEAVRSSAGFTSIPDNINTGDKIGLALTELPPPASADTSFCMNGTYIGHNDIAYHITEAGEVSEGLCEGAVIESTVVGEYNFEAGGAQVDLGYTPIVAGSAEAELYGFKVTSNAAWTEVTLSWDSQPGATRYEIQTRNKTAANVWNGWYYRQTSTGGSSCSGGISSSCSNGVPAGTTSLTWTDTTFSVPLDAGKTYGYQIRPCTTTASSSCSAWSTLELSNPVSSADIIPDIRNFSVTPSSDWSNVNISWTKAQPYVAKLSSARYEIQTRNQATSSNNWNGWYYRQTSTGGSSCSGGISSSCSNGIPRDTTSISWTDTTFSVPSAVGKNYQYRIRNCVDGHTTYCGAWAEASLSNPIQSNDSVPAVSNFQVTPSGDWSSVTLSWSAASNYSTDMPSARYEIQTRNQQTSSSNWNSWGYRATATGGSNCSGGISPTCSNGVPLGTLSYSWTDTTYAVPPAGKSIEYQIRNCVTGHFTYCGPWAVRSLTR